MGGRVLLAEDSTILQRLLADALRAHGVADTVESFDDGNALLSAFRLYAQAGQPLSLVILDVELPGGPDGLVVGRTLRALETQLGVAARAPILFFSAHPEDDAITRAVADCAPAHYVQKTDASPAGIAYEGARFMRTFIAGG